MAGYGSKRSLIHFRWKKGLSAFENTHFLLRELSTQAWVGMGLNRSLIAAACISTNVKDTDSSSEHDYLLFISLRCCIKVMRHKLFQSFEYNDILINRKRGKEPILKANTTCITGSIAY